MEIAHSLQKNQERKGIERLGVQNTSVVPSRKSMGWCPQEQTKTWTVPGVIHSLDLQQSECEDEARLPSPELLSLLPIQETEGPSNWAFLLRNLLQPGSLYMPNSTIHPLTTVLLSTALHHTSSIIYLFIHSRCTTVIVRASKATSGFISLLCPRCLGVSGDSTIMVAGVGWGGEEWQDPQQQAYGSFQGCHWNLIWYAWKHESGKLVSKGKLIYIKNRVPKFASFSH